MSAIRRPRSPVARIGLLAGGWTLLVVGALLLVLPGPGIPLVLAGLAVLSRESPWARRLTDRGREWIRRRRGQRGAEPTVRNVKE